MTSCYATKYLSSQIPQFGGTEEDNVELWIEKLESVTRLHGCTHSTMLAAATSRLTKTARRWFDYSTGTINESWIVFRAAIVSRFRRKIFHGIIIQKVEVRKWLYYKESFADYAMDKIVLMQPLRLSDEDAIQFLTSGITSASLRANAASLKIYSLDDYLREMQHVAASYGSSSKRLSPVLPKKDKYKESSSSSENAEQQKKKDLFCSYCRGRNHVKEECYKFKKKKRAFESTQDSQPTTPSVAAVGQAVIKADNTVAYVKPLNNKIVTN